LRGESKPCWGRAIGGQGGVVLFDGDTIAGDATVGGGITRGAWPSVRQPAGRSGIGRSCWRLSSGPACARQIQRVTKYGRARARSEVHCAQPERVAARNKGRGVCHVLWNELSTALGATACQYGAAILRSHTCTEAVRARTPHFARLIGALHSMDSVDGPSVSKRAARLSR
jgi:hypothetical protein